eukprot:scaffold152907_cov17-Tisochrysis_lutea.AAC.3
MESCDVKGRSVLAHTRLPKGSLYRRECVLSVVSGTLKASVWVGSRESLSGSRQGRIRLGEVERGFEWVKQGMLQGGLNMRVGNLSWACCAWFKHQGMLCSLQA